MFNFDWYQGTIYDHEKAVFDALQEYFPEKKNDCESLARKYRYSDGFTLTNPETMDSVKVLFGGQNGKHGTHFVCTSSAAVEGSSRIRQAFGESHHVTRADAYSDIHGDRLFEKLRTKARAIARESKIKAEYISDAVNRDAGATQYLGSRASPVRARIYQKGLELLAKHNEAFKNGSIRPDGVNMDVGGVLVPIRSIVRVEAQIRPLDKESKQVLSKVEPGDVFGYSPWLKKLALVAFNAEVNRLSLRVPKTTSFERSVECLISQYGGIISELMDRYGPEGAGTFLSLELAKRKAGSEYQG